jgi:Thiolase, C-terminal domain
MGMGPVLATRKALARAGLRVTDLNVVEVNEAFGSQAVACLRELEIDRDRVNLDGGGISIGHPLGATGAASRRKQHRFSGSRVSDTPSPPSASAGARASQQSSKRSRSTRAKPHWRLYISLDAPEPTTRRAGGLRAPGPSGSRIPSEPSAIVA